MLDQNKIAVISTGNAGQAFAAYFAHLGYRVSLYAREQERVDMFSSNRFVLSGIVEAESQVELISCKIEEVIRDAALIMVTTPAQYHSAVAKTLAPHLADDQIVVLNPGRTFGTYEFDQVLRKNGCTRKIRLAEAETLLITCRCRQVGHPSIYSIKSHVLIAAHRVEDGPAVLEALSKIFPNLQLAQTVLETGFSNTGMIFHPLPILMNLTRVEKQEEFLHYIDGITPIVARMLERLDAERVGVAARLGITVKPVFEWLQDKYGAQGETLHDRIQNAKAYAEVYAPTDVDNRYVFEDVCTGCVPLLCVGRMLGMEMPMCEAVIKWAGAIYEYDFYKHGRNDQKMDIRSLIADAPAMRRTRQNGEDARSDTACICV